MQHFATTLTLKRIPQNPHSTQFSLVLHTVYSKICSPLSINKYFLKQNHHPSNIKQIKMKVGDGIVEETPEQSSQHQEQQVQIALKNKFSWGKLVGFDSSFDLETGHARANYQQGLDWRTTLTLAFQCIGVVYGDLGTSPLYVFPGIFPNGVKHNDDILGVLSLILWLLTLITLIKYVFVVLSANDNGDGGTFALYSLICRYAKVNLIPSQQVEDKDVSNYRLEVPNRRLNRASAVKTMLENSSFAKYFLLFIAMLGTSMVIGDGVITPCVSVLSAVSGIRETSKTMTDDTIMWISVVILIILFQFQRFGTDKIGYMFSPILTVWFIFIGSIGFYNFIKYDPGVIKAINPVYILHYFIRNKKDAWISLGGILLCLTGSEALFADLGHFYVRSIQISTCCLVFPSIVLAYIGQAAYLQKHNYDAINAFYKSVPKPVYWPMFVVAVMSAVIASQSLISAAFSIVQQSLALGCFPRVKIVHTSTKYKGQVYIPEINNILMIACIGLTLGFKTTLKLSNAYGLAVAFVMTLTSGLLVLVMIMVWKTNICLIIAYALTIYLAELFLLSSALYKFVDGGYLPIAFSAILVFVMYTWNCVYRKKYKYELENKVPMEKLREIANDTNIRRVPGIALFYSELVHGISPIFSHYVANVPALHSVIVFLSIKSLHISKVPEEEQFLFRRLGPQELPIFRCVVRYGYTDKRLDSFEDMLVDKLKEFIREDLINSVGSEESNENKSGVLTNEEVERAVQEIDSECKNGGLIHLIGESEVVAANGSCLRKRVVIDYAYSILNRFLRQQDEVFAIPRRRMLKVGMTYEL